MALGQAVRGVAFAFIQLPARVGGVIVNGHQNVAFVVPSSRSLHRLIWLDAADRVMASTTAVPRYGYIQFQP